MRRRLLELRDRRRCARARRAHRRRSAGQSRRAFLRDGRRASARHRHDARQRRHRHPRRPPLLQPLMQRLDIPAPPAPRSPSTTPARKPTNSPPRSSKSANCSTDSAMSDELNELYQDIILDHHRRPRNRGRMDEPSAHGRGIQPLCGDELTVFVKMDGDKIADIKFTGQGCAISQSSASLMTQRVKGKTRAGGPRGNRRHQNAFARRERAADRDSGTRGRRHRAQRRAQISRPRQMRDPLLARARGGAGGSGKVSTGIDSCFPFASFLAWTSTPGASSKASIL